MDPQEESIYEQRSTFDLTETINLKTPAQGTTSTPQSAPRGTPSSAPHLTTPPHSASRLNAENCDHPAVIEGDSAINAQGVSVSSSLSSDGDIDDISLIRKKLQETLQDGGGVPCPSLAGEDSLGAVTQLSLGDVDSLYDRAIRKMGVKRVLSMAHSKTTTKRDYVKRKCGPSYENHLNLARISCSLCEEIKRD